jgi:hypothetical protein
LLRDHKFIFPVSFFCSSNAGLALGGDSLCGRPGQQALGAPEDDGEKTTSGSCSQVILLSKQTIYFPFSFNNAAFCLALILLSARAEAPVT